MLHVGGSDMSGRVVYRMSSDRLVRMNKNYSAVAWICVLMNRVFQLLVVLGMSVMCGSACATDTTHTISVAMTDDYATIERACAAVLSQGVVRSVTHESDVYIDPDEFAYLIGYTKNCLYTSADLALACVYLQKKRTFSSIDVVVIPGASCVDLVFRLKAAWRFNKVKFEGVVLGKDMYRHHYVMEPGERFDPVKHEHSLESIRAAFYKEGYLHARVYDYFDYDERNRTVTVHIVFEPNERYVVDKVDVVAQVALASMQDEADALIKQLKVIFVPRIERQYYQEEEINKQTAFLKEYLVKRGFFSVSVKLEQDVDHRTKKMKLIFVVLFKQKRLMQFSGNRFFSERDLYAHVGVFGTALSSIPIDFIKEEIERLYSSKGFDAVHIDVTQQDEIYSLHITEGARAAVDTIVFQGVKAFPHEMLLQQFLSPCLHKGYDEQVLEAALEKMRALYQKEGFWDCAVVDKEFTKNAQGLMCITLIIDEGIQRFVRSEVVLEYPDLFEKKQLEPYAHACGKVFDQSMLADHKRAIVEYFRDEGYTNVQVTYRLQEEISGQIDIVWTVGALSTVIKFGRTVIVGKSTIPFAYIRKELSCIEGTPWNIERVEETIANLRRIGIHEAIYIYPETIDVTSDYRAVMLKLVEDDPLEIRLRAGFQQVSRDLTFRSGTTYKIGGSVMYKNPLHVGDCLSADVDATRYYRNLSFEYHWPWFFGKRVGTSLKGYSIKYIQPVKIGSKHPLYQATQRGILLFFGRRYTQINWGFNVGMEYMETNGLALDLAQAIDFAPRLIDTKVPYFFFEPTVLLDYLDDKLNPTRGSLSVISCKGMFPWKEHATTFFKIMFEQSAFYPARPGTVLAGRIRFGHIFQNDFSRIMPTERFYLGGENSLRGYDYDHVPPLGIYIDEDGHKQHVPHGGRSMVNINMEVRIDLFDRLSGVLFQDIGTLIQKDFAEIKGGRLFAASGFGFRYHTPIGPLRFDMGFKWKKRFPSDLRYAWFLTLGHAF